MSLPLLIVRPQPGANATAMRAQALGLETLVAPLFEIVRVPAAKPRRAYDALLVTSANGARHMPDWRLKLPVFAVGQPTAQALRERGIEPVFTGSTDGAQTVAAAAAAGHRTLLWPTGEQHSALDHAALRIDAVPVYAAQRVAASPALQRALTRKAVIMAHSARAARAIADTAAERGHLHLVAMSAAVADAAGGGWASVQWPARPRDADMLELARRLCQKRASSEEGPTER